MNDLLRTASLGFEKRGRAGIKTAATSELAFYKANANPQDHDALTKCNRLRILDDKGEGKGPTTWGDCCVVI